MNISEDTGEILKKIKLKYDAIDQQTDTQLEGLLWSNPITYWDYVQTDTLLNLQIQRTVLPDEMVFILYHQVNELTFKMILWEITQIANVVSIQADFFMERLERISRYFDMLTTSFSIMEKGMGVGQYMKFRSTLAPASGFQSTQYRLIEFATTDLINLVDYKYIKSSNETTSVEDIFEKLYWQATGKDNEIEKKSFTLEAFEKKYKTTFLAFMKEHESCNIWQKFKKLTVSDQKSPKLIEAMRHFDYTVNYYLGDATFKSSDQIY